MRRFVSHSDRLNAPIAGFIAALTCIFEVKSRRQLFTVLMMSRSISMGIQAGETNEIIPKVHNKGIWLWVITNVITQTQFALQSDILNPGIKKFYTNWSAMTKNDKALVDLWHR
jgi:hypothetical protein